MRKISAIFAGLSLAVMATLPANANRLTEEMFPKQILRLAQPGELEKIAQAINNADGKTAARLINKMLADDASPGIRYMANNALCVMHTRFGEFDRAIAACNEALAIRPSYWVALNSRGTAYLQMQQYEAAMHDYERAAESAPKAGGHQIVSHNLALAEERRNEDG